MIDDTGYHLFVVMNSQQKLTTLVPTWGCSSAIGTPTRNSQQYVWPHVCLLPERDESINQDGSDSTRLTQSLHSRHINDKRLGAKSRAEILRQQILRGSQEGIAATGWDDHPPSATWWTSSGYQAVADGQPVDTNID